MNCLIPSIPSLGDNSPAQILLRWIEARTSFQKSASITQPLFCTVSGNPRTIGNKVSADSFRKLLTSHFAGNTSTHSLRKGGARFFAKAEAPEQATMFQGGWRTTESMRSIYTTLSKAETRVELHKAANSAGCTFILKSLAKELLSLSSQSTFPEVRVANKFLNLVLPAIGKVDWKIFVEFKVGVILKRLVQHPDENIRSLSVTTLGRLRGAWAAHKALARAKH